MSSFSFPPCSDSQDLGLLLFLQIERYLQNTFSFVCRIVTETRYYFSFVYSLMMTEIAQEDYSPEQIEMLPFE